IFGGMIVVTDLHLIGLILKERPVAMVVNGLRLPKRVSLTLAATMGILLFCCKAEQYYYNEYFRIKLLLLAVIAVHALVYRRQILSAAAAMKPNGSIWSRVRLAGIVSLVLWSGVLVAGRAIGYVLPRPGLHMK